MTDNSIVGYWFAAGDTLPNGQGRRRATAGAAAWDAARKMFLELVEKEFAI